MIGERNFSHLHIIAYAEGWNILIGGLQANQGVAKWLGAESADTTWHTHYHMHIARVIWKFGGTSHRVMQIIFGLVQSASSPIACVFAYAACRRMENDDS